MAHITTILKIHHPWERRKVKSPKATRRIGKFKAWSVGTSAKCPERLLQSFWAVIWGGRSAPPGLQAGVLGSQHQRKPVSHLHAAKLDKVSRERERPETCELKRESSQCSWSFC